LSILLKAFYPVFGGIVGVISLRKTGQEAEKGISGEKALVR